MTFVGIRELGSDTRGVIAGLAEDDKVMMTDNSKPVAFMMSVCRENFDETVGLMQKISASNLVGSVQEKAKWDFPEGLSDEEIQAEIDAERKGK